MESSEQNIKKRFCSIKSCPNNSGSTDTSVQFFRAPNTIDIETRTKWEIAITGKTDGCRYNIGPVCERHFRQEDISTTPKRRFLKTRAFPMHHTTPIVEMKLVDIDAIKNNTNDTDLIESNQFKQLRFCEVCIQKDVQLQGAKVKIASLIAKINELLAENRQLRVATGRTESRSNNTMNYDNVLKNISVERTTFKDELVETMSIENDESTSESVCDLPESPMTINVKEEADVEMIDLIESSTLAEIVELRNAQFESISDRDANKFFKCGRCEMAFDVPAELGAHVRDAHTKTNFHRFNIPVHHLQSSGYKCKKCGMTFEELQQLSSHMKDAHTISKSFQCHICKIKKDTLDALRMHMKLHGRNHTCDICKAPLTFNELNNHLCGNEKQIHCEYCQTSFTATLDILEHLKTHRKKRNYRCEKCPQFLPMITLKEYHMKKHAKDQPKTFICSKCPKAFAKKDSLSNHQKTHNAERTHLCDECGKGFPNARNLRLHKESSAHAAERTYLCPHCPQKFFRDKDLRLHSQSHKEDTYLCEICNKELQSLKSYRKHKGRHLRTEADRKHACTLCTMKFFDSKTLRNHQLVHSNKRLHQCQYCEQSYKYIGDLHKHLKTHLGDKIYQCKKCSKRFKYYAELQKHELEHYKEETNDRSG